jgi:hypothetical protein
LLNSDQSDDDSFPLAEALANGRLNV